MGDFDDNIARLEELREQFLEDLRDIDAGQRTFHNEVDVTPKIRKRVDENLAKIDIFIAAYKSHNE